jgi:hypothetical protein
MGFINRQRIVDGEPGEEGEENYGRRGPEKVRGKDARIGRCHPEPAA